MKTLFLSILITGVIITLSAASWFSVWLGLEINMMAFLPMMINYSNQHSYESCMKYFLSQALASSFLLLALSSPTQPMLWPETLSSFNSTIILMALALKLGAAPFHFWFPPTMEGLSWPNCMILATVQKISPLILMSFISSPVMMIFIILSAMTGAIGGYNQTVIRKLMAYSSIGHLGWMMTSAMLSQPLLFMYMSMYIYMSTLMMMMFYMLNQSHLAQTAMLPQSTTMVLLVINMLSLGGLPPFLGFMPKWAMVQELMNMKMFFITLIMIISSVITLFYYMRITYSSFMKVPSTFKTQTTNLKIMMIISIPSIMGLPTMIPVMNM